MQNTYFQLQTCKKALRCKFTHALHTATHGQYIYIRSYSLLMKSHLYGYKFTAKLK